MAFALLRIREKNPADDGLAGRRDSCPFFVVRISVCEEEGTTHEDHGAEAGHAVFIVW